ncbi:hypothetical protein KQY30_06200 [Streptomyces sp. GMY02]|uniref:hypothetical protein n=1 Tax=Streptomyces sp. GMY02 TaxID=1333528 RepID=UPI001C2C62DE|nr:hypothetical protein [Streptomyces sp. GMY02]QXE33942.1 hypothetical protein KQY30_06200 [Streptomyces sp. GMY02]
MAGAAPVRPVRGRSSAVRPHAPAAARPGLRPYERGSATGPRAAAARRAVLVTLLVLIAFLGMSLARGVPAASGAEPPPPAAAGREPAGEGQQDTAETEQTAPGRTERAGGPRFHPVTRPGQHGPGATPYTRRCAPALPPRQPAFPRCVVLRC